MASVLPFRCIRPAAGLESRVAALPYDVYNREEARVAAAKDPLSFLNIDRPETQFPAGTDIYAPEVYQKAGEMLRSRLREGIFVRDEKETYSVYELTMDGRSQTGIVACVSLDDFVDGTVRKHENTREEKERDRLRHVTACQAQTGPIFLACRAREEIREIVRAVKADDPAYSFLSEDGIRHRGWIVSGEEAVTRLRDAFASLDRLYIADGHHRAASAVRAGLAFRERFPGRGGQLPSDSILSVIFPDDELMILDYNRVVRDLNGMDAGEFLRALRAVCGVKSAGGPVKPSRRGMCGMFLEGRWYEVELPAAPADADPVSALDVSLLQSAVLAPLLGIGDPRTDPRIDFVGGIRGLPELERRVREGAGAAFSMYPTSVGELFAVADRGLLMPPKSTWFEPKLRSGLYIHDIAPDRNDCL